MASSNIVSVNDELVGVQINWSGHRLILSYEVNIYLKEMSKITLTVQDSWFLGLHKNCWPAQHEVFINSQLCRSVKSVAEQGKKMFKLITEQKGVSMRNPLRGSRSGRDVIQLFCISKFRYVRMVVSALIILNMRVHISRVRYVQCVGHIHV